MTGRPETVTLIGDKATALFRIFQEALTIIVRHAKATAVEIVIDVQDKTIILEIRDNGIGIDKEMINASGSLGLLGMQERAKSYNGQVHVEPLGDGGTLVRVIL